MNTDGFLRDILEIRAERDRRQAPLSPLQRKLYEVSRDVLSQTFDALTQSLQDISTANDRRQGQRYYEAVYMGIRKIGEWERHIYIQPSANRADERLDLEIHAATQLINVSNRMLNRRHWSPDEQYMGNVWLSLRSEPSLEMSKRLTDFAGILEEVVQAAAPDVLSETPLADE